MTDIIERLRRDLMDISYDDIETMAREAAAEIARLRAALEPFARNAKATSLLEALEHIEREHLLAARAALEPKP